MLDPKYKEVKIVAASLPEFVPQRSSSGDEAIRMELSSWAGFDSIYVA